MAGITGLMPRHGNTQRLIGSRIPITGTAGCRAYLYWHGTDRTDTAYRDIIRADGPAADLTPHKRAGQTVDISRVNDVGLDAGGIEFRGSNTPCGNTVCAERTALDTGSVDADGIDLCSGQRAGVDTR